MKSFFILQNISEYHKLTKLNFTQWEDCMVFRKPLFNLLRGDGISPINPMIYGFYFLLEDISDSYVRNEVRKFNFGRTQYVETYNETANQSLHKFFRFFNGEDLFDESDYNTAYDLSQNFYYAIDTIEAFLKYYAPEVISIFKNQQNIETHILSYLVELKYKHIKINWLE